MQSTSSIASYSHLPTSYRRAYAEYIFYCFVFPPSYQLSTSLCRVHLLLLRIPTFLPVIDEPMQSTSSIASYSHLPTSYRRAYAEYIFYCFVFPPSYQLSTRLCRVHLLLLRIPTF